MAACFSPFNAFTLGISQPIAGLPLFSGFAFRGVVFVLAMASWAAYLAWYTLRFRIAPALLIPESRSEQGPDIHPIPATRWKPRDVWVLAALNSAMAAIVLGGTFLHWELRQFSAVFLWMGFACGLAGGMGWRGTSEQFAEGFRRVALASALVGFARAISVVLANGQILDTIANALFSPLRSLSLSLSAVMMLIAESVLAFPISSESGRAMMSLPIMIPIADLLGLSRQMVVIAFQYSALVSGIITPTSGALLAMLAIAGVSYGQWLRFVAVPFALLFTLCVAAMVIGVKLGIQ